MADNFFQQYFSEVVKIAQSIDTAVLDKMVERLSRLRRDQGRLFLCGVGGSAANCSHAVNDFRKLTGIEAYAPTDYVSELTARTNDEGWQTVFSEWLKISHANNKDVLMIFSVGGGNAEKNISANLVAAIDEAKARGLDVMGIVGRDGGYTKKKGDFVLVVPTVQNDRVTPHTEGYQAVVWHALVSDARLAVKATKWESTTK